MHNINESQINPSDVKAIFKDATALRSKPSLAGRFFKNLRKDKIDINDLQQSWKDDGYPDDIRDIKRILLGHGFDKKEVAKIFSEVFGSSSDTGEYSTPTSSPIILKIANYAKQHGLAEQLIAFMEEEFADELGMSRKVTTEDIRQIFTKILNEDRTNRTQLINAQEAVYYGRNKK